MDISCRAFYRSIVNVSPELHVRKHYIGSLYDTRKTWVISTRFSAEERRGRSYLDDPYAILHYIRLQCLYSPNVDAAGGVVHTPVTGESPAIFEEVLKRRDAQNEYHGDHRDLLAECVYSRHPIEQHDEDEVQIGHTVELL